MKLIDVDNFEKRLWIEYKKTKNSYISSGIALVLGMLNDEPTFTEQDIIKSYLDKLELQIARKYGSIATGNVANVCKDIVEMIDNLLEQGEIDG